MGWRLAPGQGIAGWVVKNQKSLIVSDLQKDERHYQEVNLQGGLEVRSMLSMPIAGVGWF